MAAFLAARLLVWGVPLYGPWVGLALVAAAGLLLREKGPILWMAAGAVIAGRLATPESYGIAAMLFGLGAYKSAMPIGALLASVLLPMIVLREAMFRFRPGWQEATYLFSAGAALIVIATLITHKRAKLPAWKWWPGFAAAAVLFAAATGIPRWIESRNRAELHTALAALPKADPAAPYPIDYFHKGVSFTAEGVRYDAKEARTMLNNLPAYGIDSIALVPYVFSPRGEIKIRIPGPSQSMESEEGMEILIAEAHRLKLRVLLKPHVWRLQGRSGIPGGEARLWLAEYKPIIEHYAQFASRVHADALSVGTELRGLTAHEKEWREIVAGVRKIYKGPLVYAANHGEEFETIRFWDALDYIGIDNYYPLDDTYSASELVSKIEAVHQRFRKPVLFTEAGFAAHQNSHREPWEDESAKPLDLAEQARSYQALLNAVYKRPWFRGVYWWKVGTNGYGGPGNNSMTPWRKPAMEVVKRYYLLY